MFHNLLASGEEAFSSFSADYKLPFSRERTIMDVEALARRRIPRWKRRPLKTKVFYPDSDGQPMADNTVHYECIVTLKGNPELLFADNPDQL